MLIGETRVTDACVKSLLKLQSLEFISLVGCNLSEAALLELAKSPSLKRMFLWKVASATPEVREKLKRMRPDLSIE